MKIEAVIVCRDYSDFLAHTLPENIGFLDRCVVVTHPDDKATQSLCTKFGVDFVATTEMNRDGDKMNKGRCINLGLSHLKNDGWLLHLDADIVLPHKFRQMLDHAQLNTANIYGADRLNTGNYENWMAHKNEGIPQHAWRYLVNAIKAFDLGARLLHAEYGWCPIGYFQLWHSSMHRQYPVTNGSSEHSDVLFAVQWPRPNRVLLPEFFVYHLESEQGPMGQNWNGRKSKHFGPGHPKHPPSQYRP